jgi:hypothetical protein
VQRFGVASGEAPLELPVVVNLVGDEHRLRFRGDVFQLVFHFNVSGIQLQSLLKSLSAGFHQAAVER